MKFVPAGKESNALVKVASIIEFENNLSQEDFHSIDSRSDMWNDILPRKSLYNGVMISPEGMTINKNLIESIDYDSLTPDGSILKNLRIEKSRIIFITGKYNCWFKVWPEVEEIFSQVINSIKQNSVRTYSSEYQDLFRLEGEYFENDLDGLLQPNNNLISSHIFSQKLNWHSHTGFFRGNR